MRRLFHKVVCTAPGVTEFGNGVLRVKCKQNTVVEMPCGVWLANWRRHSDKLFIVEDALEEGTIYPPVAETADEHEPLPTTTSNEQPRISIDNITAPQTPIATHVAPNQNKRSYNKRK